MNMGAISTYCNGGHWQIRGITPCLFGGSDNPLIQGLATFKSSRPLESVEKGDKTMIF